MNENERFRNKRRFFQNKIRITDLTDELLGAHVSRRLQKEVDAMITYMDLFTFVIMLCAVIALVYDITHKK